MSAALNEKTVSRECARTIRNFTDRAALQRNALVLTLLCYELSEIITAAAATTAAETPVKYGTLLFLELLLRDRPGDRILSFLIIMLGMLNNPTEGALQIELGLPCREVARLFFSAY